MGGGDESVRQAGADDGGLNGIKGGEENPITRDRDTHTQSETR